MRGERVGLALPKGRWHEPEPVTPPDPRIPDVRRLEALAERRLRLADAALLRARREAEAAEQALAQAEQALADQITHVADERQRLLAERQALAGASGALRIWRQEDERLLASIPPRRHAVTQARAVHEEAETALYEAMEVQQRLSRKKEKYSLLIEQLLEA